MIKLNALQNKVVIGVIILNVAERRLRLFYTIQESYGLIWRTGTMVTASQLQVAYSHIYTQFSFTFIFMLLINIVKGKVVPTLDTTIETGAVCSLQTIRPHVPLS